MLENTLGKSLLKNKLHNRHTGILYSFKKPKFVFQLSLSVIWELVKMHPLLTPRASHTNSSPFLQSQFPSVFHFLLPLCLCNYPGLKHQREMPFSSLLNCPSEDGDQSHLQTHFISLGDGCLDGYYTFECLLLSVALKERSED